MSNDELVNVLVPKRHLSRVYGLIAELEKGVEPKANGSPPVPAGSDHDDWTASRIRRMVEQSPPAMRDILKAMATRAGDWLTTEDLAKSIEANPDADWNTVAGTIGAFGRRMRNRYGIDTPPFEKKRDHDRRCKVYRMDNAMATQILQCLDVEQ